nr:hypothetical protein [Tanacetum cinerariifolium]GEY23814.1 hypothetical protein [Tanacetum cinerariifolium]
MSTLAEFMIVAGADNHPPMFDKPMYESKKNHIELYIQGKDYGQIILNLVKNGPLIWPTVEQEDDTVRLKTYKELSDKKSFKLIVISRLLTLFFKAHANEARLMRERFPDPLTLVANYHQPPSYLNNYHSLYTTPHYQQQFSPPTQHVHSSLPQSNPYGVPQHLQQYPNTYPTNLIHTQPSVSQNAYLPPIILEQPQADNQATIQDGKVTVQQVQGRQVQNVVGSGLQRNASGLRGNTSGEAKVVKCYNFQGKGHMDRQCTQPKRRRDKSWIKEKTDDLDAYDSDYDDISSAKMVIMANLLSCDSNVLFEVPYSSSFQNDIMNQGVQELQYSEQLPIVVI